MTTSVKNQRKMERLIFERSGPGRVGFRLPPSDVPVIDPASGIDKSMLRRSAPPLPEVSEVDVVRHYARLSSYNYSIDSGLYPLGSCTMKHNPRVNELLARLPAFASAHPLAPEACVQGCLALMYELQQALMEISGMDVCTLAPAAGAHGELTGMMAIHAYHADRKANRPLVLIPDSAHGTNPASASCCGQRAVAVKSGPDGRVDLDDLKAKLTDSVGALMMTNPNTLGVFETGIREATDVMHRAGALVYCDGANLNALTGRVKLGDCGVDVLHINLHKTFSTPHGGGGPGSGPVCVKRDLAPFLPVPVVSKQGDRFSLDYDRPKSVGKVGAFHGNFGIMLRAMAYILALGSDGLKRASGVAVLNANYIRHKLLGTYHLQYPTPTLHEVVFSDKEQKRFGVSTLDIAKRLMDYGFHPPTIYFPLIVAGALMIEPTESEDREELDAFIHAMLSIAKEAETDPDLLKTAPHTTPVRRLDEALAARKPVLRWTPDNAEAK